MVALTFSIVGTSERTTLNSHKSSKREILERWYTAAFLKKSAASAMFFCDKAILPRKIIVSGTSSTTEESTSAKFLSEAFTLPRDKSPIAKPRKAFAARRLSPLFAHSANIFSAFRKFPRESIL